MGSLAPNQALAIEVVERLLALGVRTFCLCPGGRNAPLVEVLERLDAAAADVLDFFEERSAAFFALGRSRRDRRPVAVVTTSGTACAELLPAMVEAYYAGVPLVALTADRPRSYRGTGAPQAIEQAELFGVYARQRADLERPGTDWQVSLSDGPTHINVSFDEPLLGGWETTEIRVPKGSSSGVCRTGVRPVGPVPLVDRPEGTRPLVLLGALPRDDDRAAALEFCQRLGAPVLAECSSRLKPYLGNLLLTAGEAAAQRGFQQQRFDSVIRLGDIPSFRLWRDLESAWRVPVLSVSRRPWRGLTHGTHRRLEESEALCSVLPAMPPFPAGERESLVNFDRDVAALTDRLLAQFPDSEPALVRRLSRDVPDRSFVYLGNSQPIREWNQFAEFEDRGLVYGENRGANGIDGQLSTFLGEAADDRENWAIVGDLTALYDLSSPWALRYIGGCVRLVVVNNLGGRIFERMFANPRFQNRHEMTFRAFADLWRLEYCESLPVRPGSRSLVVELRPDDSQTQNFWSELRAGIPK